MKTHGKCRAVGRGRQAVGHRQDRDLVDARRAGSAASVVPVDQGLITTGFLALACS